MLKPYNIMNLGTPNTLSPDYHVMRSTLFAIWRIMVIHQASIRGFVER
jgi:hypothetical protein